MKPRVSTCVGVFRLLRVLKYLTNSQSESSSSMNNSIVDLILIAKVYSCNCHGVTSMVFRTFLQILIAILSFHLLISNEKEFCSNSSFFLMQHSAQPNIAIIYTFAHSFAYSFIRARNCRAENIHHQPLKLLRRRTKSIQNRRTSRLTIKNTRR